MYISIAPGDIVIAMFVRILILDNDRALMIGTSFACDWKRPKIYYTRVWGRLSLDFRRFKVYLHV